ncbi:MAG: phosphoglycerate dehydrogenase [Clostridia bacterium]|nr:phosphoglycerate dehydrogenase [Clostridia bacterium]
MYKIQTLNAISPIIDGVLRDNEYAVSAQETAPDGILVRSAAMHDMELPQSLLAVARAGAGVNNIPVDKCAEKGIVVFNTPGANANAVAELVVSGMLLASRDIEGGMAWVKTLKGQGDAVPKLVEKGKSRFVGPELRGKTLGVVGLGAIGVIVANIAADGLGMKVIGYDPWISIDRAWSLSGKVQHAATMDDVLAQADYITFHVPLNDNTRGSVNAEMMGKMKPGVRLLNFSRGELVDNAALKDALADGKVAKYVTDFPCEELIDAPGVVCIPHLGASTPESEDNCAVMAAFQLKAYLEYGSIENSVNMPQVTLLPTDAARLLVIHQNIPNMLSGLTAVVSAEGINIDNLVNKSRKDYAVTVMDLPSLPNEAAIEKLKAIPGVVRARTFGK